MSYQCPICQCALSFSTQRWHCQNNHSFDLAKEGYVNLMPVQHKHSKEPGDNQLMMQSRRVFLASGHYSQLSDAVNQIFLSNLPDTARNILDIGCGEGYYTSALATHLKNKQDIQTFGIDIAKGAVKSAAKCYKHVNFCVASSYRLPFMTNSIDGVLRIYAPSEGKELIRMTSDNAVLITVTPAPNHLKQLKALIYSDVKLHSDEIEVIDGFVLQHREQLSYVMELSKTERLDLLQMTPFAWRANDQVRKQLSDIEHWHCDADFYISVYRKKSDIS